MVVSSLIKGQTVVHEAIACIQYHVHCGTELNCVAFKVAIKITLYQRSTVALH